MAHMTADGSRTIHFHTSHCLPCVHGNKKSNMINGKKHKEHMAILLINKNVNKKLSILHIYI